MDDTRPMFDVDPEASAPAEPRLAATVIVLRGAGTTLELLLVRRTPHARFMAGAWVFPGGSVEPADGAGEAGLRAAGVRELSEEAGIVLEDPARLVTYSRWITPPESRIRFDTWFFLAIAPAQQTPRVDGGEIVDARWQTPAQALGAAADGEMQFAFPTLRHLEQLSGFHSVDELLAHASGREVTPLTPRVLGSGETARIVLPGESGYDD